jgi:hypothetical protein
MANKKWSEMSTRSRLTVVLLAIVELVLTTVALRDLSHRDRAAVRGPKLLWRLVCFVQPVGPVLYLALGRRGPGGSVGELVVGD